jgi:3-phosphoshikimate 1-carboxyvinyltransferase
LRKVGAQVVEGPDFIRVTRPHARPLASAAVHTYDDHRMAMCLSLAAFNPLTGGPAPQRILDPRCVAKTFPDYFEALFSVAQAAPQAIPVITIDGPTASGKGTLAAGSRRPWATTCSIPVRCTAPPAWPRYGMAWRPKTPTRWPAWPAAWR